MTFRFQILNVFFPLVILHQNSQLHGTLALPLSSHTPRTHFERERERERGGGGRERERERSTGYKSECQFIKRNISHIRVDLKWGEGRERREQQQTTPKNKNKNKTKKHTHTQKKNQNRKETRLRISLIREPSMETKSSSDWLGDLRLSR